MARPKRRLCALAGEQDAESPAEISCKTVKVFNRGHSSQGQCMIHKSYRPWPYEEQDVGLELRDVVLRGAHPFFLAQPHLREVLNSILHVQYNTVWVFEETQV